MPPPRSWPESLAASAAFRRGGAWRNRAQEERRAALLDAAEGLFAAKGLLQTGLQEIGAEIGLAPYAVRAQFGNREMVLEAVLDRHMDRLIDRLGAYEAHAEAVDPAAWLTEAVRALLDLLWAYRAGQRVHVAAVAGASPHLARSLKLRQRHVAHYYAGLIARAVPEAEGRTELAMPAALSLMGMACWHVLWFREMGALSRAEYARLPAHMVIDGVRAAALAGVGGLD
ncbi:MAG: TetR family transcriptional regulator [Acetobacteraceae bacterium]|nr:TetR family transcriptional regulator [Acetobacteraceae bacterium]